MPEYNGKNNCTMAADALIMKKQHCVEYIHVGETRPRLPMVYISKKVNQSLVKLTLNFGENPSINIGHRVMSSNSIGIRLWISNYILITGWGFIAHQCPNFMMTSSNGSIFRFTGPSCEEFTGHRWIPLINASESELWCFLWSGYGQTFEWTIETLVICDATVLIVMQL